MGLVEGTRRRRIAALAALLCGPAFVLSGCGGLADIGTTSKFAPSVFGVSASPRVTTSRNVPKGGGRYQVGQPYRVAGRWYEPREQPDLDVIGQASWYGPNFHGRQTANGEIFDQYHLSGAHPTLPLPSYVRVTNVENGRSAVVRINDRGPFTHNRVIDLSRRSAEVLGFINQGVANVRVQYVGPAPVNGDDTQFLVASIDMPTPLEQGGNVQYAYQDTGTAVAGAADAIGTLIEDAAPPADIPFQVMTYAAETGHLAIGGAHEAVGAIEGNAALEAWRLSLDADARAVHLDLGAFADPLHADAVAQRFALIGAVDRAQITVNGAPATQLTLSYLKPGVVREDVLDLAAELGLGDVVLY